MELKEYLTIFRKKANLFGGVVLAFVLAGALFFFLQPAKYRAELVLNVTRTGQDKTADYQFDDFYRLQADERFADTIVRWLETGERQQQIKEAASYGDQDLFSLSAKRLSSQIIEVEIVAARSLAAEKMARSVPEIVNQEAEKLNQWQQKENWFRVIADDPTVAAAAWAWHKIILISLLLGIFAAFWAVLLKHYLE